MNYRSIILAGTCLAAIGQTPATAATPALDCEAVYAAVDKLLIWKAVARGLDFTRMDINLDNLSDLTLVRYSNAAYRGRPFDLRDVVIANQNKGFYAPPLYAVSELKRNLPQATLIVSAGLTKSYSEPIPAGFLRIDGTNRTAVARKDERLDGVVCFSHDGRPSIQSEIESGTRRAPRFPKDCLGGFQAGPVLVADGSPTTTAVKDTKDISKKSRVVLGLATGDYTVIGYSAMATTAAMACGLSSSRVGAVNAISLQGDTLGGIGLGSVFEVVAPKSALGNTEATIASALVVEPRGVKGERSLSKKSR